MKNKKLEVPDVSAPVKLIDLPEGIEFHPAMRSRIDAILCRVTQKTTGKGPRYSKLHVARWVLQEAGFKPGKRYTVVRGKAPHHRWIRVEEASFGQKLGTKGTLSLTVGGILKRDLQLKNEEVTPLIGGGAIYFELPNTWMIAS